MKKIIIKKMILLLLLLCPIISEAMVWNKYKRRYTSDKEQKSDASRFIDTQIWPIKLKENSVAVKRFLWHHGLNPQWRIDNPSLLMLSEVVIYGWHHKKDIGELFSDHDPSLIMQALKLAARFKATTQEFPSGKAIKTDEWILHDYWKSLHHVLTHRRPYKAYKSYYQHPLSALPIREKKAQETLLHTLGSAQQRELEENARNHQEHDARVEYAQELRDLAYADACCASAKRERRENEFSLLLPEFSWLKSIPMASIIAPAQAIVAAQAKDSENLVPQKAENLADNAKSPVVSEQLPEQEISDNAQVQGKEEENSSLQKDWVLIQA